MGSFARRQQTVSDHVHPTDNRRQRRAQFVGDSREKFILSATGSFSFATGAALFFEQPRVVDRQRDTKGDQLQQSNIVISERARREATNVHYPNDATLDQQWYAEQ